MPPLKVELSKSARARCQLKQCGQFIAKGELRVGTGAMMPGMEDYTYKFRHVCCFTKRQLASVDGPSAFVGYDDLCEDDQKVMQRLCRGELVDKHEFRGRVSPSHLEPVKPAKPAKKATKKGRDAADDVDGGDSGPATPARPSDASVATVAAAAADDVVEADAGGARAQVGWPMSVALAETNAATRLLAEGTGKPPCPYGALCFRDDGRHKSMYVHP